MDKKVNFLKVRDDSNIVMFTEADNKETFDFTDLQNIPRWINNKQLTFLDLRNRIEPWLTSLFQSEHLSLLIGSGLTHAVHYLATNASATGMDKIDFADYQKIINDAAQRIANNTGRENGNLEDQLRIANELLRGLEICQKDDEANLLREKLKNVLKSFAESILKSEFNIITAERIKREAAFNTLVTFLMSFASRTGTRDRLNIFTTNYDRLIEAGAEVAGMHLLDRFSGTLMPIFRSSRLDIDMHYNPPGIRGEPRYLEGVARFTKLHGSVDWVQSNDDIRRMGLPFGANDIEPYLQAPGLAGATPYNLMIYPNSAKDRETAYYPYVDLFRDFAGAICRPNSTVITYGYSFGDDHINRIIRDMLTIPSTHLVIISYDDSLGRIMRIYKELGRHSQISLLIGPALSDLTILTEYYLPKAAIDKTTYRMVELLKRRWGSEQVDSCDPSVNKVDHGLTGEKA